MSKDEKHEEGTEEVAEGGKSKKPIIIIAVAIVVLILVGVAVFIMMSKSSEDPAAEGNDTHAAKDDKHAKKDDKHGKKGGHGDDSKVGPMLALEKIIINLVSETGTRYAKVSVAIEMDSPEVMVEATTKKAIFQDIVISVLSQKTADELVTHKGKENSKSEILEKINPKLKDGGAKNIYFTEFIIQ